MVFSRTFPTTTPQYVSFVGIIPGTLLVVGEDFVGGLDLGEEGSGAFGIAMVAIGMEFERFLAICFFESGEG